MCIKCFLGQILLVGILTIKVLFFACIYCKATYLSRGTLKPEVTPIKLSLGFYRLVRTILFKSAINQMRKMFNLYLCAHELLYACIV